MYQTNTQIQGSGSPCTCKHLENTGHTRNSSSVAPKHKDNSNLEIKTRIRIKRNGENTDTNPRHRMYPKPHQKPIEKTPGCYILPPLNRISSSKFGLSRRHGTSQKSIQSNQQRSVPIWLVPYTLYRHPSLHSTLWPCTRQCATLRLLASTIQYATLGWLVSTGRADMAVP